jgi:hypothetical protein
VLVFSCLFCFCFLIKFDTVCENITDDHDHESCDLSQPFYAFYALGFFSKAFKVSKFVCCRPDKFHNIPSADYSLRYNIQVRVQTVIVVEDCDTETQ